MHSLRPYQIRLVCDPLKVDIASETLRGATNTFALVVQLAGDNPLKMDTVSVRIRSWARRSDVTGKHFRLKNEILSARIRPTPPLYRAVIQGES